MTLEEYQEKMAEALEKLDWRNPASKESDAHKLLKKAAVDKEIELDSWMQLHEQYWKAVKKL